MANLQHRQNYCDTILGDEDGFIFAKVFEENHRTNDQERQIDESYFHNVAKKGRSEANLRFPSGQFVFRQVPGRQQKTEAWQHDHKSSESLWYSKVVLAFF